jgi:hypothetical protein
MKQACVLVAIVVSLAANEGSLRARSTGLLQERSSDPDGPERGVLAVLRRDGIMFPFASFRGSTWTAPWPGGLRNVELPINLESIPERWWGGWRPESWQAWLSDGTSRDLRAAAPAQFRVHCAQRLGVRTDYRPSEAVPILPSEPFPKDGLAVTAGVRVEPIEIVRPSDREWSALAVVLLEQFDRAEDKELSSVSATSGWSHPVSRAKRHGLPVRIESWYRTTVDGDVAVSYIEAVRTYPPGPDDNGCGLETLFSGWVYDEKGKRTPRADLGARLTYCDRMNASYMLPLGRIRVRGHVFWIAQLSGHESEWYAVARITRTRANMVAEYFAGSRDSCR